VSRLAAKLPVQRLCRVLALRRSTKYYRPRAAADETLRDQIRSVTGKFPTYGVRRVTAQVRRDYKIKINHKRVARVMREMGINRKKRRKKRKTTQSHHEFPRYPNLLKDLVIARPDQVWVCEIVFTQMTKTRVFAIGTGRDDVANFDFVVSHDYAIN